MAELKVTSALVILNMVGSETVVLTLDATTVYPSLHSNNPYQYNKPHVTMQVENGVGIQWVRDNLGIEPEIIYKGKYT
jgi:hypothetical protein